MIVLFTGISGVGKLDYIAGISKELERAGEKVKLFDIWTEMQKAAKDIRKPVSKRTILSAGNLDELRAIVLERILNQIQRDKNKDETTFFIVTHACFRWNRYLRRGMDSHYLRELGADLYVTIIDDIMNINNVLSNDEQWKSRRFDIDELSIWQNEEIFITRFMADYDRKPFYLIPRREPIWSMQRLFLKGANYKRAYISFPITAIQKENPRVLSQVEKVADELRKKIIVFNPLSIKDLAFKPGEIDEECEKHLRELTVERDYQLIDQSDMVIVFYPVESNSPGVNSEILHGYSNNKEVYLYYPFRKSPFWDEGIAITKHFSDWDSFCKYFDIDINLKGED